MQAADRVLQHSELVDPAPVTDAMIAEASGFSGDHFKKTLPDADFEHMLPAMRELFAQPEADLKRLINEFWPEMDFHGLAHEL